MDFTKSYVKVYNVCPEEAQDFEFDYDTKTNDMLTELVPQLDNWGGLAWMGLGEYEYSTRLSEISLLLETRGDSPIEWLRNASTRTHYFSNKLITMCTIEKDETRVRGVAVMDGEVLQNKYIFETEPEEIKKYYNENETTYDLDTLDDQIWDSIGKFANVCEQFYLEGKEKNDY